MLFTYCSFRTMFHILHKYFWFDFVELPWPRPFLFPKHAVLSWPCTHRVTEGSQFFSVRRRCAIWNMFGRNMRASPIKSGKRNSRNKYSRPISKCSWLLMMRSRMSHKEMIQSEWVRMSQTESKEARASWGN
jgi:hypothetical protein